MPYKDKEVRKQKHKEYSRRYYENNSEKIRTNAAALKRKKRKEWYDFTKPAFIVKCKEDTLSKGSKVLQQVRNINKVNYAIKEAAPVYQIPAGVTETKPVFAGSDTTVDATVTEVSIDPSDDAQF